MYCWKDTNSVSNFSYTLPDTCYVLLERHEQHQKLLQHNNLLDSLCPLCSNSYILKGHLDNHG